MPAARNFVEQLHRRFMRRRHSVLLVALPAAFALLSIASKIDPSDVPLPVSLLAKTKRRS
jgi:hypothetical protein